MSDVYLDLCQLRKFRHTFQPESVWDLIFPRESSALRISMNIGASTLVAGLWAHGWQKFKKITPGFYLRYTLNAGIFSFFFFSIHEVVSIVVPRQFNIDNIFLNNALAGVISMSLFTLYPKSFFFKNKTMMLKYFCHLFLYSLYFDIFIAFWRDRLLGRFNRFLWRKNQTLEDKIAQITAVENRFGSDFK